jgi:hypothetical protein
VFRAAQVAASDTYTCLAIAQLDEVLGHLDA